MDEFQRIARLKELFARPRAEVPVAIGDDCAVLAPSGRPRVWTVDVAVEGVHFDRRFMPLEAIGSRAFMAAASDVAAMGARAVAALSSLVLPRAFTDDDLEALARGIARAADACGAAVVGGNLARGGELSLTTSVLGECDGPVVTRSGARPGQRLYVTGPLGGAALGLSLLSRGLGHDGPAVQAFLAPRARLDCAPWLATTASAAIDVSDGLLADLAHLCEASGVGATVDLEALPTLPGVAEAAAELGLDPRDLAAHGGEDYELLFASDRAPPPGTAFAIGTIAEAPGLRAPDGTPLAPRGFDHFRARPT